MSALPFVASVGVSGALFLLVTGLTSSLFGRHRAPTEARLSSIAGVEQSVIVSTAPETPAERGAALDRRITALPIGARLKRDLRRAGLAWRVGDYVMIVLCTAAVLAMAALTATRLLPAGIGAGVIGALAPIYLVRRRASKRASQLNAQVGDLLDLLASSMRAGFGF